MRRPALLLAGVAALALLPSTALAYLGDLLFLPPHANYQRLSTEHFEVVYPQSLSREAELATGFLEQAWKVETVAFQYIPARCTVILTDNEDFANGVTSAVGLQGIVLFMTAPDPYSSIGEYDHWLKNLIIHEYAHWVTLEQTHGLFEFLRYVFGNLLFPNHAWPSWLAEGMAVYAESTYTLQGRGHGTYYTTLTRDALHRHTLGTWNFLEFNQLSGVIPDFPFGEGAYYSGYAMIDQMMAEISRDAPARYAEESAWRIPYFLNGALENISHDRYQLGFRGLWEGWIKRQSSILGPDLAWLRDHAAEGAGDPRLLSPVGAEATGARLSPDGKKLAYALTSGNNRPAIAIQDLDTKAIDRIDDAITGVGLAWSPDGRSLYYAKTDFYGPYALFSDLYKWTDGSVERLTHGERAKDPDLCGAELVYSRQQGRISEIRALAIATGNTRVIYRAPEDHHVSNPRCSSDGRTVYFADHGTVPLDAVYSADTATGAARRLFGGHHDGFGALFPDPAPNGDVYFTRVIDDYYELARYDAKTRKISPVARGPGGYWLPRLGFNSSWMAVSYLSSTGLRAALIQPERLERLLGSAISKAPRAPEPKVSDVTEESTTAPRVQATHSSYNLLTSLQPRIWTPFLSISDTQTQIGGEILGWDDVDQLEYNLFLWYDSVPRKPQGVLGTFHRVETFKLGLTGSDQVTAYATNGLGQREYNEQRKLTASLSRPFPGYFARFTPTFLVEWARTWQDGDFGRTIFNPDERLGLDLAYDTRSRFPYSLAAEQGYYADLSGRTFFSGSAQAWKGLASWEQLVRLPPAHSNLDVTGYYVVSPNPNGGIPVSQVSVGGHGTLSDLNPPLRGYPLGNFGGRRAAIIQAEYRVPFAQFFRGFETFPLFLQNLGAFAFYDGGKIQPVDDNTWGPLTSGVGGGLILNSILGYQWAPIQIRLEYAHGLQRYLGGQDVVSFNLSL
jgi:Tol biopolymer transport system component